jgi:hypothetical protein
MPSKARPAALPTLDRAVAVALVLLAALVAGACAGPAAIPGSAGGSPAAVAGGDAPSRAPDVAAPSPSATDAGPDTGGIAAPTHAHASAAPWTPDPAPATAAPAPATGAPAGSSSAPAAAPTPALEPFTIRLSGADTFVGQYTFEWCVGASLQMALAMTTGSRDRSRAFQEELWEAARDQSFSPYGGANPRGWTAALNDFGAGPYELVSIPTFDGAVRTAAAAISATGRPVGLVMWRGRHAWVMSGFESIGDPAVRPDAEVTRVRVLDPLHPHGSSVWGPSPAPDSLIGLDVLARQFVAREYRPSYDLGVPTGWLLVLPVAAAP